MKRRASGSTHDKRSNSRWLWTAVELGRKGGEKKSHKHKNKRVAMVLLPGKESAPDNKLRGNDSLAIVMRSHLKGGSRVVADDWSSTPPAVQEAGSQMEGTVNHFFHWRNPVTGHHSNDAEPEFARLRLFLRTKNNFERGSNNTDYDVKSRAFLLNVAEYLFYTNVGRDMKQLLAALRYAGSDRS